MSEFRTCIYAFKSLVSVETDRRHYIIHVNVLNDQALHFEYLLSYKGYSLSFLGLVAWPSVGPD